MWRPIIARLLAAGCVLAACSVPARAEVTAEQVRQAIDRGVAFLKREQRKDGSWPEHPTLVVISSMHGAGGVRILSGTALLKDAGQPIVLRSNPAFFGERS